MENRRAKNFTEFEKNLLVELAGKFVLIIENKKTDAKTVKKKKSAWDDIAKRYNSQCQTGPRNVKQLHFLYDILKRKARDNINNDEVQQCKTVGGSFISQTTPLDEKIVSILQPQFEALDNPPLDSAPKLARFKRFVCRPSIDNDCTVQSNDEEHATLDDVGIMPTCEIILQEAPQQELQEQSPEEKPNVEQKKIAVTNIAKRIMKRKNVKTAYERELHELKKRLMHMEEAVLEKELENKTILNEHLKKKLQIELESAEKALKIQSSKLHNLTLDCQIKNLQLEHLLGKNNDCSHANGFHP